MNLTTRDKWILAVLPAIVTGLFYMYGQGGAAQRRLTQARAELEKERAEPVNVKALAAVATESDRVQDALAAARETSARLTAANPARLAVPAEERGEALRTISNSISAQGLFLMNSTRVPGTENPATIRQLLNAWSQLPPVYKVPSVQVWKLEVWGSYTHFARLCDDLAASQKFIVPLSVTMEPLPQKNERDTPAAATPRDAALQSALQSGGIFKWTVTLWL